MKLLFKCSIFWMAAITLVLLPNFNDFVVFWKLKFSTECHGPKYRAHGHLPKMRNLVMSQIWDLSIWPFKAPPPHTRTHTPHHTHVQGYEPIIFYPKRTSKEIYQLLVNQCEKLNIAFIDELPSQTDIDRDYHVAVDAIFGFNFKGAIRPPFERVLSTLRSVSIPIASVDIPSGNSCVCVCVCVCVWLPNSILTGMYPL